MQKKRQERIKRLWPIVLVCAAVAYAALAVSGFLLKRRILAKPYPLSTCIVGDRPLKRAYVHIHEGKKVLFCCRGCRRKFIKSPEKYTMKLDKAYAEIETKE